MQKKTYHVPDIGCSMCAISLEALEDDLPGVKRVSASYRRQRLEVEFDETQVSEAQVIEAIEAQGYTVTPL
jgi:copper chaperone CopZ